MQLSSDDPPGLLRAFQTACALATAAYEGVDLDMRAEVADVDPVEVAFALAAMLCGVLQGWPAQSAHEVLEYWGGVTAAKQAQLAAAASGGHDSGVNDGR